MNTFYKISKMRQLIFFFLGNIVAVLSHYFRYFRVKVQEKIFVRVQKIMFL